MPRTRRQRVLLALPAAALVASVITVTGPAGPAAAAAGCVTEAPADQTRCDDTVPPETTLVAVAPVPRADGRWVSTDRVEFTFTAQHTDADTDPIAFECQLDGPSAAPAEWSACTSPATFAVPEQSVTPYTFRVRAIDVSDDATDATAYDGFDCMVLVCQRPAEDLADVEQTPATTEVRVDRTAPSGSVRVNGLVDEENPDWPMVTDRDLQVVLAAGGLKELSPVDFACTLSGKPVRCSSGTTDLRRLPPGDHTFQAVARDAAGNVDPTPAVLSFAVPRNLTAGRAPGWKVVRQGGYFAGDFLQTTTVGAAVTAPGRNVRELRLIAPRGPKLGKVEVKIGQSIWRTIDLQGPTYERFHVYQVRDQFEPLVSGRIRVRAAQLGRGESVRIDAVLAH